MSLSKDYPQPLDQLADLSSENPRSRYRMLIKEYATLTRRIRQAERLMVPTDEIAEIDVRRHSLHKNFIKPLAESLMIDADQTQLDMIASLGDLEELGIKGMPVLRLPMVGSVFNISSAGITQPQGQYHTLIQMAYCPGEDVHSWPGFNRIETSKERWKKERTFALLYFARRIFSYSNYVSDDLDGLLMRRNNLAVDQGLNLFFAQDITGRHESFPGHGFISPMELFGVEVPALKINKVAQSIRENSQLYATGLEGFSCFSTPNISIDTTRPAFG